FCFQAEDSIRDRNVTGVQTCALPIYSRDPLRVAEDECIIRCNDKTKREKGNRMRSDKDYHLDAATNAKGPETQVNFAGLHCTQRSEERRVGKGCEAMGAAYHESMKR